MEFRFSPRRNRHLWCACFGVVMVAALSALSAPVFSIAPAGNQGFDVLADGAVIAPVRLASGGAIQASNVETNTSGLLLSGLHTRDPLAVTFAPDDFISVTIPATGTDSNQWEPVVRFKLTIESFDTNRWLAMFPDGAAPFHFLACSLPTAQVWHQRGWLNATPLADPFPLLQDVHTGSPEISCLWNRNWSYLCPLGAHPVPMIGLWDPEAHLYVGYDFQGARAGDQSERFIATGYCWNQAGFTNFIALAFPYGGTRYGEQTFPAGGEVLATSFNLEINTALPPTEDPNEQFQARLFQRYTNALPLVPAMNDLAWIPGKARLTDFAGPIGVGLFGPGGETTFYQSGTVLMQSWQGHQEMPIDTAVHRSDWATVNYARAQMESLLTNYAQTFNVGGESCLFWQKPLSGAWLPAWGGASVTTLHNSDGWYAARVLVELYRYDRNRGQPKASYLQAIDQLFNWSKHYVWTRNEFADVPSSPFAIGATLNSAFLLDYYFTFRDDPLRSTNAALALHMADTVTWRYVHPWAMDSDHFDGTLDSSFLIEPNSGRDWSGLGCANEVNWNIDAMTQVYVHTGDPRMRYYLRGILQRWPVLYQPNYENSILDYNTSEALTEGLGVFDGSGPGRGSRYPYGFSPALPLNEPVGASSMRVIAGAQACIAFDKNGTASDVADYRTGGYGSCTFRIVSTQPGSFDVSFSYPFVDISQLPVTLLRNGQLQTLSGTEITRPPQSPSSLYLSQLQDRDVITVGTVPVSAPVISFDHSLTYEETQIQPGTNGLFFGLALPGNYLLPQDWNDLSSFAGLVPGPKWTYTIPYWQTLHAVNNPISLNVTGATVVVVAYSPPQTEMLTRSPKCVLDDNSTLAPSGHPVLAWRAWPIIFQSKILLDYMVLPPGRSVVGIDPNGTLLMGATRFDGSQDLWQPIQDTLSAASTEFVQSEEAELAVAELQASFSQLPAGHIALLPLNTAGPGVNFAAATGLRNKWDTLTEQQLIDTNQFNAARYPVAFYLGGENYVKTVVTSGDGKTAITRYLAAGGTLVVLASGPFPFYYGYGPADQAGPADPLLPALGLPFQGFEQAPPGVFMQRYTNQTVLHSVPTQFPFPPGDQRLRAITGSAVNSADRYLPLIKAIDAQGTNYGDAAAFVAFGAGPAKGGKLLYVWDTLLSGPQGQAIMADTVSWILNATLRPPAATFDDLAMVGATRFAFHLTATTNLDYTIQSRTNLSLGAWTSLQDLGSSPVVRSIWTTNVISSSTPRFYRLRIGP